MPKTASEYCFGSTDIDEAVKKRRPPWRAVNWLIIFFVMPCLGFWGLGAFRISLTFGIVMIISCVVTAAFYGGYARSGRHRKKVIAARAVSLASAGIIAVCPLILVNFENQRAVYPLKRLVYTAGVGQGDRISEIFPDFMPDVCEDYLFVTQTSLGGQDYHPSAYLAFHTDRETIERYEAKVKALGKAELLEGGFHDPERFADDDMNYSYCPTGLPLHVFSRVHGVITEKPVNPLVYEIPSYYGYGCMLDYETGLAVFWT